jgi:hypothetical protein
MSSNAPQIPMPVSTYALDREKSSRWQSPSIASHFRREKVRSLDSALTYAALEIATAGKLRAVPHLVKGSNVKGVARNTLAVFIQNDLEDILGVSKETFAEFASRILNSNLVQG